MNFARFFEPKEKDGAKGEDEGDERVVGRTKKRRQRRRAEEKDATYSATRARNNPRWRLLECSNGWCSSYTENCTNIARIGCS